MAIADRSGGIVLVGVAALLVNLGVGLAAGKPWPTYHDEFSYLLAGDTFAQGRLTNPPHPLWEFFESIHIIVRPSYQSKYPPGQGLMLALGQVVFGEPIAGVWISWALASMAVAWMLRGWLPGRWAMIGGLVVALHHVPMRWWNQHYWGGAVAVMGGALMLGGMRRALQGGRVRDGAWMGLGLFVLAISRPYEGVLLAGAAGIVLVICERKASWGRLVVRSGLGALLMLGPGLGWLGYYNWRVTGSPIRLPYLVHEEQYGIAPLFVFQRPRPMPEYRHAVLRDYQTGFSLAAYNPHRTWGGWLDQTGRKLLGIGWQYSSYGLLAVPILIWAVLRIRRRPVPRPVALGSGLTTLGLFALGMTPCTWILMHYVAPAMGLWILVVVGCAASVWEAGGVGRMLLRAVGAGFIVALGVQSGIVIYLNRGDGWANQRAALVRKLEQEPGKHLVLCPFGRGSQYDLQWVYNGADIDGGKTVWARDMGPTANRRLLDYYADRRLWRVIEWPEPRLIPLVRSEEMKLRD